MAVVRDASIPVWVSVQSCAHLHIHTQKMLQYQHSIPVDTEWSCQCAMSHYLQMTQNENDATYFMINGCKLCSVKISRATAFSHITSKLIKLSTRSSSLGAHDRALTQYIVIDDHPPSVLENEGFHLKEAKNTSLVVEVHRLARGHCLNQGNINGAK